MISERLTTDMKAAMKSREKERLSVIRMLLSELKNARIASGDLTEEDEQKVVQSYAKKRKESIDQYTKNGRDDLAKKEEYEYGVTMSYLPEQLDGAELESIVRAKIEEVGATSPKEMGKVIKAVMAEVSGRADGSTVSATVKKLLAG